MSMTKTIYFLPSGSVHSAPPDVMVLLCADELAIATAAGVEPNFGGTYKRGRINWFVVRMTNR